MTRDGVLRVSHDSLLNRSHARPDGQFSVGQGPAFARFSLYEVKRTTWAA